jgi:hypothetical protein
MEVKEIFDLVDLLRFLVGLSLDLVLDLWDLIRTWLRFHGGEVTEMKDLGLRNFVVVVVGRGFLMSFMSQRDNHGRH